jgi:hypothetical protein
MTLLEIKYGIACLCVVFVHSSFVKNPLDQSWGNEPLISEVVLSQWWPATLGGLKGQSGPWRRAQPMAKNGRAIP